MKTAEPIILASASPRRKKILKNAGIKFKAVESKAEEYLDPKLEPHELAKKLSLIKARDVHKKFNKSIIIAADTFVVCGGKIFGKPKDKKDAKRMLSILSNKTHLVITGLTIIDGKTKTIITKSEETKIHMREISKEEIESYVETKEPFDKAGAYAIQGKAGKFIKKIDGDLDNAIGLPIDILLKELRKSGAF